MTPEEFRRYGHRIVDFIADYRTRVAQHPVMSPVEPGAIKAQLPRVPPEQAEAFDAVLRDVEQVLLPGLSHWQSPRFFGYFPANSELSSVLGDYLSTGLGVLGLSWQAAPALTELEEVATDWMRQIVGLSDAWSGVIQDTASTSSLVALICARERTSDYALARGGLQGNAPALTVYVSQQSHSSVEKAALLAGFGRAHVRAIPVDHRFAMRADALEKSIRDDLAQGLKPCAIVGTSGTTASTAFDPLTELAALARQYDCWMHVDAAMAGSAMILPECRALWAGVEGADSLVFNPHKWLGVAFDCSLYYVRDPQHLVRVLSTTPSYLQSAVDQRVKNLRDWGIPLGRRFRALKLWCLIREQGVEGLRQRIRRDLENARWLEQQVQATPRWQLLAPVALQTLCLRHEPPGLAGEALDRHTQAWAERVNRSGAAYLTPAVLDGRWMVRVSIGSLTTERAHVAALWEAMRAAAESVHPA
jgi:aromatic-L-amino-acid/L-tryptophan decarboxylase